MTSIVTHVHVAPDGGVPKTTVGTIDVRRHGVIGDRTRNPDIHGGPDAALLLIDQRVLDRLCGEGFRVYPGALGENVTTRGVIFTDLAPGTRVRIGEALLEVVKQRVPCSAIDVYGGPIGARIFDSRVQHGDVTSPVWGASGLMFRVIEEGQIAAGDPVVVE